MRFYHESLTDLMACIEKQDHDPGIEQQLQAHRLVKEPGHGHRQKVTERHTTKVPTSPQPIAASRIKRRPDVRLRPCGAAAVNAEGVCKFQRRATPWENARSQVN